MKSALENRYLFGVAAFILESAGKHVATGRSVTKNKIHVPL